MQQPFTTRDPISTIVPRATPAGATPSASPTGSRSGVNPHGTLIAGTGLNLAIEGGRFFTQMVAGLDRSIRPLSLIALAAKRATAGEVGCWSSVMPMPTSR